MAIFAVGNRVVQARYGTGTVISSNEYHTVVEFDEHGVRNFSTAIVKLEKSATMAPRRKKTTKRKKTAKKATVPK